MKYEDKKERLEEIAEIIKKYPEALQIKVFDFLTNESLNNDQQSTAEDSNEDFLDPKLKTIIKSSSKKTTKKSPQILGNLNLRPTDKKSLITFIEEKKPSGNIYSTATFVYYLNEILEIPEITPNHIYTCYRELGKKIPANLEQNLRDCASSRYGYIDYKDNKCEINVKGINFVEQDLPQKKK